MKTVSNVVLAGVLLIAVASCSTIDESAPGWAIQIPNFTPGTQVILLEPKVQYEIVGKAVSIDPRVDHTAEIRDDLTRVALAAFRKAGVNPVIAGDHAGGDRPAELARHLAENSAELLRGYPPVDLLQQLRTYGGTNSRSAVIVQHLKLRVGPDLAFDSDDVKVLAVKNDPMGLALNTAYVRVALIDCQTGSVLWRNSAFLRETVLLQVPTPRSRLYRETVDSLYQPPKARK